MITVDENVKNHIINDLVENRIEVMFPNNSDIETITMDNIVEESMTLKQSICNESKLKFGGCISSEFSLSVFDTTERAFTNKLKNKWILVKLIQSYLGDEIYPNSNLNPSGVLLPGHQKQTQIFYIFCGYIDKFEQDAQNTHFYKLTAYDYMAKLNSKNGANALRIEWKNATFRPLGTIMDDFLKPMYHPSVSRTDGILSDTFITGSDAKKFYDFPTKNENWLTSKNGKITYGNVIRDCCEMLGVFGFIMPHTTTLSVGDVAEADRVKGNFRLIYLESDDAPEVYDFYEDLTYEDYKTNGYINLNWLYGGNHDGNHEKVTGCDFDVPDSAAENDYDLTDNVMCWHNEVPNTTNWHILADFFRRSNLIERFYNESSYIPFTAKVDGRFWVQVGDNVQFNVYETNVNGEPIMENGEWKVKTVRSIVLSRTLTGIQALTDTFETKGEI